MNIDYTAVVERFETKTKIFDYSIVIDGLNVSVQLHKIKAVQKTIHQREEKSVETKIHYIETCHKK